MGNGLQQDFNCIDIDSKQREYVLKMPFTIPVAMWQSSITGWKKTPEHQPELLLFLSSLSPLVSFHRTQPQITPTNKSVISSHPMVTFV